LRKNEKGATAIFVALILTLLLGFAALGIDVNYLYGVRNELQNAADAGALAGASVLFTNDCTITDIDDVVIPEAEKVAKANKTGNHVLEDIEITVQIGHWSFTTKKFVADAVPINAVRVQTDRRDTPSFFAKTLGFERFFVSTVAVAWLGYPESFFDQPIALCLAAITDPSTGLLSCDVGKMTNNNNDTGGWSNLSTDNCSGGTNTSEVRDLICEGSPQPVEVGKTMGMLNGMSNVGYTDFFTCWQKLENSSSGTKNWNITLPVVECTGPDGMDISPCLPLKTAVNVNVIWITRVLTGNPGDEDTYYADVPRDMTAPVTPVDGVPEPPPIHWTCEVGYRSCWISFVNTFNIGNANHDENKPPGPGDPDYNESDYNDFYDDLYQSRTIYFLPDCTERRGGEDYYMCPMNPLLVNPLLVE